MEFNLEAFNLSKATQFQGKHHFCYKDDITLLSGAPRVFEINKKLKKILKIDNCGFKMRYRVLTKVLYKYE